VSADFCLKKGNTLPMIKARLKNPDGSAMNLTGGSVRFRMRAPGSGVAKVDAVATIVDAATGQVAYAWVAGDTDAEGMFDAEWPVTLPGGDARPCRTTAS
jgi:hypothetical protein